MVTGECSRSVAPASPPGHRTRSGAGSHTEPVRPGLCRPRHVRKLSRSIPWFWPHACDFHRSLLARTTVIESPAGATPARGKLLSVTTAVLLEVLGAHPTLGHALARGGVAPLPFANATLALGGNGACLSVIERTGWGSRGRWCVRRGGFDRWCRRRCRLRRHIGHLLGRARHRGRRGYRWRLLRSAPTREPPRSDERNQRCDPENERSCHGASLPTVFRWPWSTIPTSP
jgi:hypothetical protein